MSSRVGSLRVAIEILCIAEEKNGKLVDILRVDIAVISGD